MDTLMDVTAPRRKYELRDMFDALRWMARAGAPWRMLPNDFPPWELVYQQTQRWLQAGCFEHMVCDLRSVIGVAQGRQGQPSAVILDGRTIQSTCESGPRAGYDGISASAAVRCILRWTRWDSCSRYMSHRPMSRSARR
jgi:transposase